MSDVALLLLVVLAVLLVIRGPRVLPALGAALGRGLRDVRRMAANTFDRDARHDDAATPPEGGGR